MRNLRNASLVSGKTYQQWYEDEWDEPKRTDFKLMCCDCGLVHKVSFRVYKDGRFRMKMSRDNRATGQIRRYMK